MPQRGRGRKRTNVQRPQATRAIGAQPTRAPRRVVSKPLVSQRAVVATKPSARSGVSLAKCTEHYGHALLDPFDAWDKDIPPVCVPDHLTIPSVKARYWARGVGATGTTGIGFVVACPQVPGNDANSVNCTSATSVCTPTTTWSSATNTVNTPFVTPFTKAQIAAGVPYRIVACGLRARYTGTALSAGGLISAFRNPLNASVTTGNYNSIVAQPTAHSYGYKDELGWTTVLWKPAIQADLAYSSAVSEVHAMGLAIASATVAVTFEWQAVVFVEWAGSLAGVPTSSDSDAVGFGAVQSALTMTPQSHQGDRAPSKMSFFKKVADIIKNTTSFVSDHAGTIASVASLL